MAAPIDWVVARNDEADDAPAGGLARVTGIDAETGALILKKPDADSQSDLVVIGDTSIVAGQHGKAASALRHIVAFDNTSAGGPPAAGDAVGSLVGSWLAHRGQTGFTCLGGSVAPFTNVLRQLGSAAKVSAWKEPVRVATTVNGTLAAVFENGDSVDGVVLATGDRILIKNQTTGTENGIYTVNATGAPTRAADADAGGELVGAVVFVSEGTANADTVWICTNNAPITIGTTALVWMKPFPITVQEVDGAPIYNSINTFQFDQADGFVASQPGTNIVKLNIADATAAQAGKVSIFSQIFGGLKTFNNGAISPVYLYATGPGFGMAGAFGGGGTSLAASGRDADGVSASFAGPHTVGGADLRVNGGRIFGKSATPGATNDGSIMFLVPSQYEFDSTTTRYSGVVAVLGRYGYIDPATGNVIVGITATKTVKDGSGANQTVTIKGGIITGWT